MSAKILVADESLVKRQDTIKVPPSDVRLGRNSRNPDGTTPDPNFQENVRRLALSFALNGQIQPCECRRDPADKSLILNFGFTRYAAAVLLREGFEAVDPRDGEKRFFHDPNFLLWVKVTDESADDAFLRGIKENLERNDTTDLQEAAAQSELRTTLGWSNAAIARFYGYTNQNRVDRLERLLTECDKDVQSKVHTKQLSLHAALDLLVAPKDSRADLLAKATDAATGRVNGAAIRSLIRSIGPDEAKTIDEGTELEGDDGAGVTAGGTPSGDGTGGGGATPKKRTGKKGKKTTDEHTFTRNASDVKKFIAEVLSPETAGIGPKAKHLFETFDRWVRGALKTDNKLWEAIRECK